MRSLQIHPPLSPPHALTTANQRVPKTPHGCTGMPTRPDPPVAAQWHGLKANLAQVPAHDVLRSRPAVVAHFQCQDVGRASSPLA